MEDIYVELPTKININDLTFNLFAFLDRTLQTSPKKIIKISFKKTVFIQSPLLPILRFFLDDAKSNGKKVILLEVSYSISILLKKHGILKSQPTPKTCLTFQSFEIAKEAAFESYLDESLKGMTCFNELIYVYSYLKFFFHLLSPNLTCGVSYNLKEDWLFFSIISATLPVLDDVVLHLLMEELKMTGGHLWVIQGKKSLNLRGISILENELKKTLIIIAFPLGTI